VPALPDSRVRRPGENPEAIYVLDDPDWLDWKAGRRFDPAERWASWSDLIRATTARGVGVRRLRIVSEPITATSRAIVPGWARSDPTSSAWQARQALGARLGEIRKDASLTGRALAALCGWHESKVSRIEHARTARSAADIRLWCHHCWALGETDDLLASLRCVEDMFVEWRRMERAGVKRAQEAVLPLWERTRIFRAYSGWLIPGIVQTPAYTKAILRAIATRRGLPDDTDEAAEVRADRLRLLREGDRRHLAR